MGVFCVMKHRVKQLKPFVLEESFLDLSYYEFFF